MYGTGLDYVLIDAVVDHAFLTTANIPHDPGVIEANDSDAFIAAAKTRQWNREKSVRTLA